MSNPASRNNQYPMKANNYDTTKIKEMQNQVDDVVDVMRSNVQKVMDRDDKLTDLDLRADRLNEVANDFKTTSRKVKQKMWWKNMKMILALSCIVIVLIVMIIAATIGFPSSDDQPTVIIERPEQYLPILQNSTDAPNIIS